MARASSSTPLGGAEAQNVRLLSRRRRGIELDGQTDTVTLPTDSLPAWGALLPSASGRSRKEDNDPTRPVDLLVATTDAGRVACRIQAVGGTLTFACGVVAPGSPLDATIGQPLPGVGEWVHLAFTKDLSIAEMRIHKNGVLCSSSPSKRGAADAAGAGAAFADDRPIFWHAGRAAYLQPRRKREIRNTMWVPLTGSEPQLMGYWPHLAASKARSARC